jgi:hypothetical protein
MKSLKLSFWVITCLLLISGPIFSYEINVDYRGKSNNPELVKFVFIEGYHQVIDNNDLTVGIRAQITVKKELLNYSDRFDINFDPGEFLRNPVVKNIWYNVSDDKKSISGFLNEDGKINRTRFRYNITVPVSASDFDYNDKFYDITLSYKLEDHVFKQGEYYVVVLFFANTGENMNDEQLLNYLELPYSTSIPYRFPEDVYSYRGIKDADDGEVKKWGFKFNGNATRTFWYFDANDVRNEKLLLLVLGALIGIYITLLLQHPSFKIEYLTIFFAIVTGGVKFLSNALSWGLTAILMLTFIVISIALAILQRHRKK